MNRQQLFILLLLFPVSVIGQTETFLEKNFDQYTTSSGMSNNTVTGIMQDSTGYIWIATSSGLNRFNGSRFVQFHSNNDNSSLAAEDLTGLTWLDKNRLAVFTVGLHIINTANGCTRNLFIPYHDKEYEYKFNMIMGAMGDEKGDLYVLSRSGFYHFDKEYKMIFRFDYYRKEEVPVRHFLFGSGLFVLDKNRLMINTVDGLYVYDKGKKHLKKMVVADAPLMDGFIKRSRADHIFLQSTPGEFFVIKPGSDTITYLNIAKKIKRVSKSSFKPDIAWRCRLFKINDTCFYVTGHNSGFYKINFDPVSGKVDFFPEKYFQNYLCTGILKDKSNNFWIATSRGIFKQNLYKSQVQIGDFPPGIEDSIPNFKVDNVYASPDKVYVGTRGGMFRFNKKALRLEKRFYFKLSSSDNMIRAIVPVDKTNLLLGTYAQLVLFNTSTESAKEIIPPQWNTNGDWASDIHKDRKDNIWISAAHIYKYNTSLKIFETIPNPPKSPNVPSEIEADAIGNIWMAGHGLARYNIKLNRFDLTVDSFPFIKMMDKQVNAMAIDNKNNIWFNSNNNGLINYDIINKKFRLFSRANGLPDDNIAALIVVDNLLWMAGYSGLACMDLNTGQIVSFGKEDGFPDTEIARRTRFFYDKNDQQLYIGFSKAIARFNPYNLLRKKSPPQLFIEMLVTGKQSTFLPKENITTSWQDNDVRITIGTINFSEGSNQRFAYRIVKNRNTPWTQLGTQPSFSISSLSPGNHRIQVKIFSSNNRWPEQVKEIDIEVLPPVWLQTWFLLLIGVIMLALIYLLVRWRTTMARRKEMEKTHIEKLKADHYKNQFELEQISHYFSSSVSGKKTEDEVLWDVASNLIGRMNYEDCVIYIWNKEKTRMVQKAAYGPKGKPDVLSNDVFEVEPGQGIVGHVIKSRQPLMVNNTRTDSRYRVDDKFRLSEVAVPIVHNDQLLGVIDSENSRPNYFSEQDIKILTTIATLLGNKLKQIESERSLEAKQIELAGINEQLAEARLSALQAQMNPHFVFNALNSIKRMILDSDNDKASRYLSKFALMIRMTLEHSKELFVTLEENIEYITAYLEMEQLRFDEAFVYNISVDENLDTAETLLPSMMIQPLVENAIWHGLMQAEGNKKIQIDFKQSQNNIICMVEDNGIGINKAEGLKAKYRPLHRSIGIENLQKRIKIINEKYHTNCSLQIMDLKDLGIDGHGTRVVLKFNLINV